MARYVALTCEALVRLVYAAAATSPHTVTVRLFEQGLHNRPKGLRAVLQEEIDAVGADECDAVLLAYGLCGAATAGLCSRHVPLVLPRAHDCITLYLGSRERYQEEFTRHPGTYWYSLDYLERQAGDSVALGAADIEQYADQYDAWVEKYGQETADDLLAEMRSWTQHYTRAVFIDTGLGDNSRYEAYARAKAEREGWTFERKVGDRRLIEMLVHGHWPQEEFLVTPAGHRIQQHYDETLVRADPDGELGTNAS